MLNSKAFANSSAIVAVTAAFVCWLITATLPDFAFSVANSWFHMINLDSVRMNSTANFGETFFGFVSLGITVWVAIYSFAEIYNRLAKK